MSFRITIVEVRRLIVMPKAEAKPMDEWIVIDTEKDILTQEVDKLDLPAVIKAINGL